MMRVVPAVAILTIVAAVPGLAQQRRPLQTFGAAAWSMNPEYKQVQRSALDAQRRLLLSMADSMPESLYRDKVTPAQRDFAQQLQHVAGSSAFIAARWLATDNAAPPASDTAALLNSRAGLKAYIGSVYDYLGGILDRENEASRNTVVEFFGGARIPRWQVWDELNQHASWTLGQVVANFRKQGKAPPPFLFF